MYRFSKGIGVAAVILSLVAGTAAAAAPGCWQEREVSAARIRQMQTMLMVATLRCRAAHLDISDDYNGFMTAQTDLVAAANLAIKQHFAQAGGSQADYDHFTTALANSYGDDDTSQAVCADAAALAHEAMAAKEAGALDKLVSARLFPAAMPGGPCGAPAAAVITSATPARAKTMLPPVLALAAPAPLPVVPAAVTLPADVVAALTVMAHYQDTMLAAAAIPAPVHATQVAAIVK